MSHGCSRATARSWSWRWAAAGRRSPSWPRSRPTLDDLLELSREGRHAASDYLETAALAGVTTVGCRRCGGGLAGAPVDSNVRGRRGARRRALDPDIVVFDGSGAAIPPVAVERARRSSRAAHRPSRSPTGYLNAYRVLVSDLVLVTDGADERRRADARGLTEVAGAPGRAPPAAGRAGRGPAASPTSRPRRRASTTTARRAICVERHGAEVVHVSGNLARRDALARGARPASTRTSTSSRSRRPRSTSSPRRRSSAGPRSCSPTTRCRSRDTISTRALLALVPERVARLSGAPHRATRCRSAARTACRTRRA